MQEQQLLEALVAVVKEVDYDIFKSVYCEETTEDPEFREIALERLVAVFNRVAGEGFLEQRPVLSEVEKEMCKQVEKWGEQNHRNLPNPYFAPSSEIKPIGDLICTILGIPTQDEARLNCEDAFDSPEGGTWAHILVEEIAEACSEYDDVAKLRYELVQSAAVITSWIEAIDRLPNFIVVDVAPNLMQAVHSGRKRITIRSQHRDYPENGKVLIRNIDNAQDFRVVRETRVRHTTLAEITEQEYQYDGFETRDAFEAGIRQHYPEVVSDSPMTVLQWEL